MAAQNDDVGLIREYDALGRMLREIDTRFGTGVGYAYDSASRLTAKVYPDGGAVHYAYDSAGRPVGISDPFGDTTRFVYDAAGRRVQKLGTDGVRTDYTYNATTRFLSSVANSKPGLPFALVLSYPSHDNVGNRLASSGFGGTTAYTYDQLDRLATLDPPDEAIYPANGALTEFAYDAAGNRTDFGPKSGGGFASPHTTYTYNAATKRLLNIKVDGVIVESLGGYDGNGNPATWTPPAPDNTPRTLKYDALGRLVSITGGFSASYAYDPFGRRIEKTEAGTTTRYQYDGLDVVAEYSASQLEATYVFGPGIDEVLKLKRGTTLAAYHSDGLGSVVSITDSSNGASLKTYRYDAFGKAIAQTGSLSNAYTYTGREQDASGLYYYRARYYLPSAGRFLTPDPIGLAGGINAYTYVSSNPVNYTDPFGLMAGQAFGPAAPDAPSGLAQIGYASAGVAGGLFAAGAGLEALGALHAACFPCGLAADVGLLGYTAYELYNGGLDRILNDASSLASLEATREQSFSTGFLLGNVAGGIGALRYSGAPARTPLGFGNANEFAAFGNRLYGGLRNAGFDDVEAMLQGSAVTGKSFRTGAAFDSGYVSDFDIALASESMVARAQELAFPLRSGGTRTGPLLPAQLEQLGLSGLVSELSAHAGRPVNFMLFRSASDATARGPSVPVPR